MFEAGKCMSIILYKRKHWKKCDGFLTLETNILFSKALIASALLTLKIFIFLW